MAASRTQLVLTLLASAIFAGCAGTLPQGVEPQQLQAVEYERSYERGDGMLVTVLDRVTAPGRRQSCETLVRVTTTRLPDGTVVGRSTEIMRCGVTESRLVERHSLDG